MSTAADTTGQTATTAEDLSNAVTYGVEAYTSEEYARAERDKLWRKVWQQVGRVEEAPEVGSFLTYDILDDSVLIVRTAPDEFRAFYNVCSHRGRRLVDTPPGASAAIATTRTGLRADVMSIGWNAVTASGRSRCGPMPSNGPAGCRPCRFRSRTCLASTSMARLRATGTTRHTADR